jgi:hypothetical protein
MQKVEDSIVGNRQFMLAVIADLEKKYPRATYKPKDNIEVIMFKEGGLSLIDYMKRTYLNGT